jgi:hypothetical protein
MIKKQLLDSIDKRLRHMRRLHNFLLCYKNGSNPLQKQSYYAFKREARSLDTLMREAVKCGDVEFGHGEKTQ